VTISCCFFTAKREPSKHLELCPAMYVCHDILSLFKTFFFDVEIKYKVKKIKSKYFFYLPFIFSNQKCSNFISYVFAKE